MHPYVNCFIVYNKQIYKEMYIQDGAKVDL